MALQHLRSSTANKRPIPTQLSAGQIAVNTNEASPGLFFKDSNGDLVKIGPVHVGTSAPNSSPASTAATALVSGTVYQILTVGNTDFTAIGASANTVGTVFTATGAGTGTGTVSGQQGNEKGEQWLDTTGGAYDLKIYDGSAWRSQAGEFVNHTGDTMTGVLQFVSGSASAPGIAFSGDTNTGIFRPGADSVAVTTGGTQRITVSSSGFVGIGASNNLSYDAAAYNLLLADESGNTGITIRSGGSTPFGAIHFADGTSSNAEKRAGRIIYGHSGDFMSFNTANQEGLRIDSSGRVGIGNTVMSSFTANAADNLVVGSGSGSEGITVYSGTTGQGSLTFADNTSGSDAYRGAVEYNHTANQLVFRTDGTGNRMIIDSNGRLLVGTSSSNAHAGADDLQIGDRTSDADSGMTIGGTSSSQIRFGDAGSHSAGSIYYYHVEDSMRFSTATAEAMRIDSSGKVLIATSTASNYADRLLTVGNTSHTSPTIELRSATNGQPGIAFSDSTAGDANSYRGTIEYNHASNYMMLRTDAVERMRIDSSGTTSITSNVAVNGSELGSRALQVQDSGTDNAMIYGDNSGSLSIQGGASQPGSGIKLAGKSASSDPGTIKFFATTASNNIASAEVMRISSTGQVGIGTPAPGATLHLNATNPVLRWSGSTSGNCEIQTDGSSLLINADSGNTASSSNIAFRVDNSEKARMDNSGRLLVGASVSPSAGDGQYANLVVQGYPGVPTGSGILSLQRGATANNVASGGTLGVINFGYSNGTTAAKIICAQDSAGGTADYPGRLVFYTTSDGASSSTPRVVINSAGTTIFGTNRTSWAYNADNAQITASGSFIKGSSGTGATTHCAFYNPNGQVGGIVTSGSSTAFNTSSDYRLKENVIDIADGITRVKQLQPKRFNFIADADTTVDGFLAHEAQTVVPEAVTGTHNEVDDDGNAVMQGIDQSKLVPLLTAALQEAIAKIETLEAKVAALEAG